MIVGCTRRLTDGPQNRRGVLLGQASKDVVIVRTQGSVSHGVKNILESLTRDTFQFYTDRYSRRCLLYVSELSNTSGDLHRIQNAVLDALAMMFMTGHWLVGK